MKESFDTSEWVAIEPDDVKICARVHKLVPGDEVFIFDDNYIVKLGEKYKNYPLVVSGIRYARKKWWQFWKRKKQLGYYLRCL